MAVIELVYVQARLISSCESSRQAVESSARVCEESPATMCELGSQGGMDGRWHCSAAQVEILLFQHADILLFMFSHFLSLALLYLFPLPSFCVCVHRGVSMLCRWAVGGMLGGRKEGGWWEVGSLDVFLAHHLWTTVVH